MFDIFSALILTIFQEGNVIFEWPYLLYKGNLPCLKYEVNWEVSNNCEKNLIDSPSIWLHSHLIHNHN